MNNSPPPGNVTLTIVLLTFVINALFGVLIARAVWRAYTTRDTDQYLKIVYLNDSLERIRSAIAGEVISWGGI
jgi:hypothetical protein